MSRCPDRLRDMPYVWLRLTANSKQTVRTPPAPAPKVLPVTFKSSSSWCIFSRLIINNVQVAFSVCDFANCQDSNHFCGYWGCSHIVCVCIAHNSIVTIKLRASKYTEDKVGPQSWSGWAASRLWDLIICCCVMTMVTRTGWSKIYRVNCRL